MNTSLFELFKIGIGPSSSHTVGPMRAANHFAAGLLADAGGAPVARVVVDLYGSLALTGVGHATDRAVLYGLLGEAPDTVDPRAMTPVLERIAAEGELWLGGQLRIPFRASTDLCFHRDQMYPDPGVLTHPNGLRLRALDAAGEVLRQETFYSVGGGFILTAAEFAAKGEARSRAVPYPFGSAAELLAVAKQHGHSIADLVLANETALAENADIAYRIGRVLRVGGVEDTGSLPSAQRVRAAIFVLWGVMRESIERGIATEGTLPGGLNVRRRAPGLARRLAAIEAEGRSRDPLAPLDAVTLAAMAVNEENAAGNRVVTAPTNGAAGVVPGVAWYYKHHASAGLSDADRTEGLLRYFLAAAAIGILYKENASISGAEVGCQGEVGVACSMAAGGLVAALGGDNAAVEHAAEIGMEHNLGMTCDPIGGLVQIPCIERNGMGAVKAVNACRLAMNDTGTHKISLDQVIETMYRTGLDMQSRYKETSLAGLALNIIEC